MDWADVKVLGHKRERKAMMEQMLADTINRLRTAQEQNDEKQARREKIQISQLTLFITRLNDEIFSMEQELGISAE